MPFGRLRKYSLFSKKIEKMALSRMAFATLILYKREMFWLKAYVKISY